MRFCLVLFVALWPALRGDAAGGVDRIMLPPYLDSVVFDIFSGSTGGSVSVFAPGADQPLRAGTAGVQEIRLSDALSSMVVRRPAAGTWMFLKSDAQGAVRVFSQEFFVRGALIRPSPTRPLPRSSSIEVTYRLVDAQGQPVPELPDYPISVELRLTDPDGHAVSLPMRRRPELGAGVFRGERPIQCDTPGRYWTEVRVSASAVELFHDRWSGFSVAGPRVMHPGS